MPEGPEVRTITKQLNKICQNQNIINIEIIGGRYQKHFPPKNFELIQFPLKCLKVKCKGKFIYFVCDNDISIWNTLGMSGCWKLSQTKHSHLKLQLSNQTIYFEDTRRFGTISFCLNSEDLYKKLKTIGPDMLVKSTTFEIFKNRLMQNKNLNKTLPEVLMNQSNISGVGNYIKSESLYYSKISPHRKIETLTSNEINLLFNSIRYIMISSYKSGGVSIQHYLDVNEEKGKYQFELKVYGSKDSNIIKEVTKDKRTTFWNPNVQI